MCWYLVAQWSLIIQIFHRVKRTQDHQTNISYGSIPAFWDKTINLISRHLNLFTAIHKAVTTSTDQVHTEHTESFSWFLLLKFKYSKKTTKLWKKLHLFFWRNLIISKKCFVFLIVALSQYLNFIIHKVFPLETGDISEVKLPGIFLFHK